MQARLRDADHAACVLAGAHVREVRGAQVGVDDRVQEQLGHDQRQQPERRRHRELSERRDADDADREHAERIRQNARHGRGEEPDESAADRAPFRGPSCELFVVAVVHLRGVADGARRDEEGNDERERVQREAGEPHEPEAPQCGETTRDGGAEGAAPVAEVGVEREPRQYDGCRERDQHLSLEVEDPAVQPWLSAHVDRRMLVGEGQDARVHGLEHGRCNPPGGSRRSDRHHRHRRPARKRAAPFPGRSRSSGPRFLRHRADHE